MSSGPQVSVVSCRNETKKIYIKIKLKAGLEKKGMRETLRQFKCMRFKRFYHGEIHDGKTREREKERGGGRQWSEAERRKTVEKILMHS